MAYWNGIKFDLSFCSDLSNKSLNYHLGMLYECTGNYVCIYVYMYLYIRVYVGTGDAFSRTDLLCAFVHFGLT